MSLRVWKDEDAARITRGEYLQIAINGQRWHVRVTNVSAPLIFAERLTREGDRYYQETATHSRTFLAVFHARQIIRRMRMDLHYGRLEPCLHDQ